VGGFEPKSKPIWTEDVPEDFEFGLLPDDYDHFMQLWEGAMHRFPGLEHAEINTFLNGPESFTTDNQYILGEAPECRNFFVAAGFNSAGIGMISLSLFSRNQTLTENKQQTRPVREFSCPNGS
jgi:glycine/D-amino acid oxidase-like deaminating enzyme